ncbi:MAG TPA: squalene/phytoene synthase family protein [Aquabacterium sp.]|nr:squalene/phytoene synthase family protein [Aquabacterium sp.]
MTDARSLPPVQNANRQAMPPVGSSIYYALQSVPWTRRAPLRDWWQWWHDISSIPYNIQDPGVAEAKLNWWRQEILEGVQGRATHPLTLALFGQSGRGTRAPDTSLWTRQIEGQIQLIHHTRWLDTAAWMKHCDDTTGSAAEGCAVLLGADQPAARDAARKLGMGWRRAHQLARLGQDARAGWVHVPIDMLQSHNVRAHELTKPAPKANPPFMNLLATLVDQAADDLHSGLTAIRQLSGAERRALKPLVVMTHLQLALLAEIRVQQDKILHERLLLTPLRKSWISTKVRIGWLR